MYTAQLYAVVGFSVWETARGRFVAAPKLMSRAPIVTADDAGQFVITGTLYNPVGKGSRVLDIDERWLSLTRQEVLALLEQGKKDGAISPCRVIDRYGSRGNIPRDAQVVRTLPEGVTLLRQGIYVSEPAFVLHLGASKEGLALAKKLGFHAQNRTVVKDDGSTEVHTAEAVITAKAVAMAYLGISGEARNTEQNPHIVEALQYLAQNGVLPPRERVAVRATVDTDFVSLLDNEQAEAPF